MRKLLTNVGFAVVITAFASTASAGTISFFDQQFALHVNGVLQVQEGVGSSSYFSSLDPNNLGSFGWTFTNTTGGPLSNVSVIGFLDAEIDTPINSYTNEYGTFGSLALPPGASSGAITASAWEIDEPGYLFGDIFTNVLNNSLDNTNAVPDTAVDDVSLALAFFVGNVAAGERVRLELQTSLSDIGGLRHTDPDSSVSFYLNGHGEVLPGTVPEPGGTFLLVLIGVSALVLGRRAF